MNRKLWILIAGLPQNKFTYAGLCTIFLAVGAIGQTNSFPSSGNVGVGTTSPNNLLEISGGALSFFNPGKWTAVGIDYDPTSDALRIRSNSSSTNLNQTDLSVQRGSGNVGIGTANPTSTLTVFAGTANIDPSLTYGAPAAISIQSAAVELAGGVATTTPWAYWLQARQQNGQAWTMSLNPSGGNVSIGTTSPGAKLEINGSVKLTANSGASITFPDGSVQSTAWSGTLCGGDYAESVDITGDRAQYEFGDVLVIDPAHPGHFLKASTPYSRLVAGIYSTKPGLIGRRQTTDPKLSTSEIPLAMVGIVPTKVTTENGPIEVGDLIVTSSFPGYAMKGSDGLIKTGSVIGKALGAWIRAQES